MTKHVPRPIAPKPRLWAMALGVSLAIALLHGTAFAQPDDGTRMRVEQLAQTCLYFSRTVIVVNRPLNIEGADFARSRLAVEQDRLADDLRAIDLDRTTLAVLLQDADPHVRTIALGALFEREDGRDLPLIAALSDDNTDTFPDLHESMSQQGGPRPISELASPQTVGEIARAMLRFWMGPPFGSSARPMITFAEYWKRYAGRDNAASWFAVRMRRATAFQFPAPPDRRTAIQSVLSQINALPSPEGEWIFLYVFAPEAPATNPELQREQALVSDEELVATAKRLGPETLRRFLQHERVTDDPDLNPPDLDLYDRPYYTRISEFVLLHAGELLRPTDVAALREQEKVEAALAEQQHITHCSAPSWAISQAKLQPPQAIGILQTAMESEPTDYCEAVIGELAGAMWQIRGPAAIAFLTDWFYRSPVPRRGVPDRQTVYFLRQVENADRPDTKQLLRALVKDARFDQTVQTELRELLKLANAGRTTPLISREDLYNYLQPGPEEQAMLARWRQLLRKEYGSRSLISPS